MKIQPFKGIIKTVNKTLLLSIYLGAATFIFSQGLGEQKINANLAVEGTMQVSGNNTWFFTTQSGAPITGINWQWNEVPGSGTTRVQWNSSFSYTTWEWNKCTGTEYKPQMTLTNFGVFTLYSFDTYQPVIVLDALEQFISINGHRVITEDKIPVGNSSGYLAVALGPGAEASGNSSVAFAQGARATGYQSFAMGFLSLSTGESSLAYGPGARSISTRSTAFGYGSYAEGQETLAIGVNASSIGSGSVAVGNRVSVQNDESVAVGSDAHALGGNSMALGLHVTSQADHSFAFGYGTKTQTAGEISIGKYNLSVENSWEGDPSGLLFTIGNGASHTERSNALEIKKNGETTIKGNAIIAGDATVNGRLMVPSGIRIQPQGDLPMGEFTAGGQ